MMSEPQVGDKWRGDWRTFTDPVIAADGYTYEKGRIEEWLKTHDTSPTTGEKLESRALIPNLALRNLSEKIKKGTEITETDEELEDTLNYTPIERPVVTANGQTYDEASIGVWIDKSHTHPMTRAPLEKKDLIPNRDLEALITGFKNVQAAKVTTAAAEATAAAALKQSWIMQDNTFTPQQQKSAKAWITEVKRDANKQDPAKKALLEELAHDTTALLKASSKHSAPEVVAAAKEKLERTITKVDKMDGAFFHVTKGKYSAGKIALAIATMGASIAIVGVREKKIEEKTGQDITSKLTGVERPKLH